ncbi:hypothetical protein D3C79_126450 [compost metagenome]
MFTGLPNKFIFIDSVPAVSTSGAGNIADFRPTVYGEILVAVRALKRNVTHCDDLVIEGFSCQTVATTASVLQGSFASCPEATLTRESGLLADEKTGLNEGG